MFNDFIEILLLLLGAFLLAALFIAFYYRRRIKELYTLYHNADKNFEKTKAEYAFLLSQNAKLETDLKKEQDQIGNYLTENKSLNNKWLEAQKTVDFQSNKLNAFATLQTDYDTVAGNYKNANAKLLELELKLAKIENENKAFALQITDKNKELENQKIQITSLTDLKNKYTALLPQHESTAKELADLKAKMVTTEADKNKYADLLKNAQHQAESYKNNIDALEPFKIQVNSLLPQVEDYKTSIAQLQTQLATAETAKIGIANQLTEAHNNVKTQQQTIDLLQNIKAEKQQIQQQNQELNQKIAQLQTQFATAETAKTGIANQLAEAHNNVKTQQQTIELLQNIKAEKQQIQQQNQELNQKIAQLQTQLVTTETAKTGIANQLAEARNNAQQTIDLLQNIKAEKQQIQQQNQELNQKIAQLQTQLATTETAKTGIANQLAEANSTAKMQNQNINILTELKNKYLHIQPEHEKLLKQVADLREQAAALQANLQSADKNLKNTEIQKEELKYQINKHNTEYANLTAQNQKIKSDLEAILKKQKELEEQNRQLNRNTQEQNTEIGQLKAQLSNHQQLHNEYNELDKKYKALLPNLETNILQIKSLNAELDTLRGSHDNLKNELDECRSKTTVQQQAITAADAKEVELLKRIAEKAANINFDRIGRVNASDKDDLQIIKGIGPFIERKLNALGIYTFWQIGNFTEEDINKVNEAIEFFPGRILRDNWVDQAKILHSQKVQNK